MSQLRSVLEAMGATPDGQLTSEELAADLTELAHARQTIEVLEARKARSLADQGGHHILGYSSPTALLTDLLRTTPGRAKQVIARGNAREKAPYAYRAWSDGRISTDQARPLFRAAERLGDVYSDAEEILVDIVEDLDAVDTRKTVEYWRQSVDGPGDLTPDIQQDRRGLHISKTSGGMHRVDAWLTPTAGQALQACLDALTPPRCDEDHRTPRQRRHDALEDLCRDWLDNGTTPTIGGEKPHLIFHTDMPALQGIAGGIHETGDGDIIDVDTLRMIACDCSVTRIVLGPESEVLDTGRKTRVWSPAQRRAIIARDRHCQGKGCRTKAKYCDIHHTDHWADGGTTSVDKGKLLCRTCHTQEHAKDRYRRRMRARTQG